LDIMKYFPSVEKVSFLEVFKQESPSGQQG